MKAALPGAFILATTLYAFAQGAPTFKARLSPVPLDLTMQATIAGTGSVTATLAGNTLTINGTFDGLKSPATMAAIHKSPARGVRGPDIAALTVSPATSGTVTGSVELTPPLLADLRGGRLYVQIHSEKAPDGNLWGWLLTQEKK